MRTFIESFAIRFGRAGAEPQVAGSRPPETEVLSTESIREQLQRIVGSSDFKVTERMRAFLTYVVGETLAGRADRIKAFTVATDVFGRDPSFDAHSDPIVRVEAGHLRRALERYYLTAGIDDPIEIAIPKGGYIPILRRRKPPRETVAAPPAGGQDGMLAAVMATCVLFALLTWLYAEFTPGMRPSMPDLPRLLVMPFDDLTNQGSSKAIAQGLTQEVIGQLVKFKDIVSVEGKLRQPDDPDERPIRYALAGAVNIADDRIRLQARVQRLSDGAVLWANSYDRDLSASKVMEVEIDIAQQVATALGQPYGVIFQADASQKPANAPGDWTAYACTLSYYAYQTSLDAGTRADVRKCLEEAVAQFPLYATAWALLSQTYVDELRFGFPGDAPNPPPLEDALAAARRAVALDPENIRGLQAEMLALYFRGDQRAALEIGKRAVAINPNDTELVGEYGFRVAMAGDWPRGCGMIEQTRDRNPGPLAYFEAALALCAYFRGDYSAATMWIRRTTLPRNANYHLIAAVVYAEAGVADAARQERDWLMSHAPQAIANIDRELERRFPRAEDRERLIRSLLKAGLAVGRPPVPAAG